MWPHLVYGTRHIFPRFNNEYVKAGTQEFNSDIDEVEVKCISFQIMRQVIALLLMILLTNI